MLLVFGPISHSKVSTIRVLRAVVPWGQHYDCLRMPEIVDEWKHHKHNVVCTAANQSSKPYHHVPGFMCTCVWMSVSAALHVRGRIDGGTCGLLAVRKLEAGFCLDSPFPILCCVEKRYKSEENKNPFTYYERRLLVHLFVEVVEPFPRQPLLVPLKSFQHHFLATAAVKESFKNWKARICSRPRALSTAGTGAACLS